MTTPNLNGSRRARIGIMGEFSAGKSTLCNLLLGGNTLPEQVTATRLAPVWLTQGPGQDARVRLDDIEEPIDAAQIGDVPVDGTRFIRVHLDAPILENCDIVDFPGISDPNMDMSVWQRVLGEMDAVIWLTHATQAWRQTEAAAWETVQPEVRAKSVLLLTRFDKLLRDEDRSRVMARVAKETRGLFDELFPVSLLNALRAGDDQDAFRASGAEAVMEHLARMIADFTVADRSQPARPRTTVAAAEAATASVPNLADWKADRAAEKAVDAPEDANVVRIVPRRIKPSGITRRPRPSGGPLEPIHTLALGNP